MLHLPCPADSGDISWQTHRHKEICRMEIVRRLCAISVTLRSFGVFSLSSVTFKLEILNSHSIQRLWSRGPERSGGPWACARQAGSVAQPWC